MPKHYLHNGDCLEALATLEEACIDAVVTDPPYHLTQASRGGSVRKNDPETPFGRHHIGERLKGFMGKTWDGGDVAFRPETWNQILRVAKPGAHLLAFGGTRTWHRLACAIEDAGWELRDTIMWVYGSGFPKSKNLDGDREGWGTALKPAWEPIIVARKPLDGTVAANVEKYGTGAINIDGCRVSFVSEKDKASALPRSMPKASQSIGTFTTRDRSKENPEDNQNEKGRWPANLVHDGSDEVLEHFPESAGQLADESRTAPSKKTSNVYGAMQRQGAPNKGVVGFEMPPGVRRGDTGSAARFFYCAKASKSDRGEGNTHPTVKPQALMRWLVRLVTPPGGLVLDPFMGSGSTGVAAMAESFDFMGIDKDPEAYQIAERRLKPD